MKQKLLLLMRILLKASLRHRLGNAWSYVYTLLAILLFTSCQVDDFSEAVPEGESNNAPTITAVSLEKNEVIRAFKDNEITASFSDSDVGVSQAKFIFSNLNGEKMIEETFKLIGTADEVAYTLLQGALVPGDYILKVEVSDTQGKLTSQNIEFTARAPFSVQPMMNMAGSFNGWSNSDNPMELVDDYLWATVDSVTLTASDEFLFIADPSFDPKFGDGDCDMTAELGGGNTACQYSGTFLVYFNDQTLAYSLEGIVILASNNDEMFVLGSMNGWGGTDLQMTLVDNFTWEVSNVTITAADEFKIANTSNFASGGKDWGDAGCDGQAEEFGSNISCAYDGTFTITFNDETLTYQVTPYSPFASNQNEMFVLGAMNGWGGTDLQMTLIADYTWEVKDVAITATDEFKFANTSNFASTGTDWGDDGCDGVASDTEDNINKVTSCNFAGGNYTLTFDDNTLDYSVVLQ